MDIIDIMDIWDIINIMDIMDIMEIMIRIAWMAMAGAVSALDHNVTSNNLSGNGYTGIQADIYW